MGVAWNALLLSKAWDWETYSLIGMPKTCKQLDWVDRVEGLGKPKTGERW